MSAYDPKRTLSEFPTDRLGRRKTLVQTHERNYTGATRFVPLKTTLADIAGYGSGLYGLEVTGSVRDFDIEITILGNAAFLRLGLLRFVDAGFWGPSDWSEQSRGCREIRALTVAYKRDPSCPTTSETAGIGTIRICLSTPLPSSWQRKTTLRPTSLGA